MQSSGGETSRGNTLMEIQEDWRVTWRWKRKEVMKTRSL
jgi:hypothetical protein